MSAKIDILLLFLILFVGIFIITVCEITLLLIITLLVTTFTLHLIILYKKELFGGQDEQYKSW